MTTIFRILEASAEDKPAHLLHGVMEANGITLAADRVGRIVFERNPEAFSIVPGSPFAYWVDDTVRSIFASASRFDRDYLATRGAYTTDDFRFYRLAWEIGSTGTARTRQQTLASQPYVGLAKGGSVSRFYSDVHLVVRWADDGAEAKAFLSAYRERKGWGTDWSACLNGYSHYFRPGLTWPLRTQSGFGMRVMPSGCIFGHKGPVAFVDGDPSVELLALLAITASSTFSYLVNLQMAFGSYEVGVIQRTPVPAPADGDRKLLAELARRAWSFKRQLDTVVETSHAFLLPPGLNERVTGYDRVSGERRIQQIQREIDDLTFDLYGIGAQDRVEIEEASERRTSRNAVEVVDAGDEDELEDDGASPEDPTVPMLSWLVGVAFGRFDLRLTSGERPIPGEPEPFDPLPSQSPGMWPADEDPPVPRPDLLVDDVGHDRDLCMRVDAAAGQVGWSDSEDRRRWLAREFFPLHIKMYSKSRRKAPIYWQLATPSASYSVWLYIHAFTTDTMFRVQNDYVVPKLGQEERRLETMERELRDRATAAERKALAEQQAFVEELRRFLDEVRRIAPLWNPNLDDGVIINFAPLWRLVPQHKPWQKELKATWAALCGGKYDWAHLAMHLWPERVVPQCAADRSLAIAHGMEDVFWAQGADGKWTARKAPTRPVDDLILERTSSAAKAALRSLLDAPVSPGSRTGRRRTATGTQNGGGR